MKTSKPHFLDAARRVLSWHRRTVAAALAFVAVWCGLGAVAPERTPTTRIVVAAHALSGGTRLAASDLTTVEMPSTLVPEGAVTDASTLAGAVVNAPIDARSPVTAASVAVGQALARPGYVVAALSVSNTALVASIHTGTRLDIIATGEKPVTLASDARVVSMPASTSGGFGSVGSGSTSLLVEVKPDAALAIASANASSGSLDVILR